MSTPWIHAETIRESEPVTIEGDELRHLSARRLKEGDAVVVFDGCGTVAEARLSSLARRRATLEVARIERVPAHASGLVLASAIPKGERLSVLLQMLTQLGVARWQPLLLDESVVRKLDADARRTRRILLEGCKVARRAHTMEVAPLVGLDELLASIPKDAAGGVRFGDREGEPAAACGATHLLLIGPEAGFTPSERARLDAAGARPVSFGPHNLRIETAAVAGAACFAAAAAEVGA